MFENVGGVKKNSGSLIHSISLTYRVIEGS